MKFKDVTLKPQARWNCKEFLLHLHSYDLYV